MSGNLSSNEIELLLNFAKASNDNSLTTIISSLLETEQNHKAVIAYLNKLLKSPQKQKECTYTYLNSVICCLSKATISENIIFWIQNVVDHNKCNDVPSIWYTIISNLIQLGKINPDFNKLMISTLLFKIIDVCLSVKINGYQALIALSCLGVCLEEYYQSCSPLKSKIELYLLQYISLETKNLKLMKLAATCFVKLQKVGNAGPDNKSYFNNWKNAFEKLCVTLDILYDSLIESVDIDYCHEKPNDVVPYQLPDIPKITSSIATLSIIQMRLSNICVFLRGMLETEFITSKSVQSLYVTEVIMRVVELHVCFNCSDNNLLHVGIHHISHQITMLYLLRSFIATFELSLLPYFTTMTQLLMDSLARTKKCNCYAQTSQYKEAIYTVLEYLIKTVKNCLNINIHDKLIDLFIDDISPITTDVSLSITNLNSVSRKKEKKLMQEKIIASTTKSSSAGDYSKNELNAKERICYKALSCLTTFFQEVCVSNAERPIKKLYAVLAQAILSLHYGNPPLPYKNEKIQMKLYEALIALLECSKPPSIGLILTLLKQGQQNPNPRISFTCTTGIRLIEKIAQPSIPSWNFVKLGESFSTSTENEIDCMIEETSMLEEISQDKQEISESRIDSFEENELGNYEKKFKILSVHSLAIPEDIVKLSNSILEGKDAVENQCETALDKTIKLSDSLEKDDKRIEQDTELNLKVHMDIDIENTKIQAGDMYTENITEVIQNEPSTIQPHGSDEIIAQKHSEKHSVDEDFGESARKRTKLHDQSPDIDEMMNSFIDELAEN